MNRIFINNGNDRNLTEEVKNQILRAGSWIKACNLYFDDTDIRDSLLEALNRGVAVFILTNLDGVTGEVHSGRPDKDSNKKKQSTTTPQNTQHLMHSSSLRALYEAGAHISGLDGLHAKYMLTDNQSGMITSLNFSPRSTTRISEIGVAIEGDEVKELEILFDNLFLRPDQYHFCSAGSHFTYERPIQPIDCDALSRLTNIRMTLAATDRGNGEALADCDIHDLRDEIFDIINSADEGDDLYIATYSFIPKASDGHGTTLGEALKDAQERGVRIHFVMRKDKAQGNFVEGIPFNLHDDIHAKAVLTPRRGILFTGNLTPESFESGFDIGINLSQEQIVETRNFITELIKKSK